MNKLHFLVIYCLISPLVMLGQIQVIPSGETRLVTLHDTLAIDSLLGVNVDGVIKSVPIGALSIGNGENGSDDQTLSLNGNQLSIENGNSVDVSGTGAIRYYTGSYVGMTSGPSSNGTSGGTSSWRHNILVGYNAGSQLTSGWGNNFLGYNAGRGATTGHRNNYFGRDAGQYNATGYLNNFFGYKAGSQNIGGAANNFFGTYAGDSCVGSHDIFVGYSAGRVNSGYYNTFLGSNAGERNTASYALGIGRYSAQKNTGTAANAIGLYAGQFNTGGYSNMTGYKAGRQNTGAHLNGIGFEAGMDNSGYGANLIGLRTGRNNTKNYLNAMGFEAGMNNSGVGSNLIGYRAGKGNSGYYLNAIGWNAGISNSGSNNVFIGTLSGYSNTNGSNNVFLGYYSGNSTTGSNNIAIGKNVNLASITGSNQINIGNALYKLYDNRIGIFKADPAYSFDVLGDGHFSGALYDSGGNSGSSGDVLTSNGGTTSWVPFSSLCDSCSTAGGSAHTGTEGSIFFAGADNLPTEDNNNLFWDDNMNWLGIGINSVEPDTSYRGKFRVNMTWNEFDKRNAVYVSSIYSDSPLFYDDHRGILNRLDHQLNENISTNICLHNQIIGNAKSYNVGVENYITAAGMSNEQHEATGLVNTFLSSATNYAFRSNAIGVTNNFSFANFYGTRVEGFQNYADFNGQGLNDSLKIYGYVNDFKLKAAQTGTIYGSYNHFEARDNSVNSMDVFGNFTYIEHDDGQGYHYGLYIDVPDSASTNNYAAVFNGNVTVTNGLFMASDLNLKDEIKAFSGAMGLLQKLDVKSYYLKNDESLAYGTLERRRHVGLIAQDVRKVAPDIVGKVGLYSHPEVIDKSIVHQNEFGVSEEVNRDYQSTRDDYMAVNYIELVPILIQAVKEQQKKIDELEQRIKKLEDK